MVRNCLIYGFWEVDEVVPITCFIIKPWELFLRLLILLCYARRRGLGLSVSMTDVSIAN